MALSLWYILRSPSQLNCNELLLGPIRYTSYCVTVWTFPRKPHQNNNLIILIDLLTVEEVNWAAAWPEASVHFSDLAAVQTHYSPGGSRFGSGIQPYLAARQQNCIERRGIKKCESTIVSSLDTAIRACSDYWLRNLSRKLWGWLVQFVFRMKHAVNSRFKYWVWVTSAALSNLIITKVIIVTVLRYWLYILESL